MKVDIYYIDFLKNDKKTVGGGGIGTLISLLAPLIKEMGHEVTIYQCASHFFEVSWNGITVIGIKDAPRPGRPNEIVVQRLRDFAGQRLGKIKNRVELFAADFFSVKNDNPYAICIQNGIAWDADIKLMTNNRFHRTRIGEVIYRFRCQLRGLRRFETCKNRVAVDLYFLNWYRSFRGTNLTGKVFYNPNPAPIATWIMSRDQNFKDTTLKIIFARRLVPEKGTRVIANVFAKILTKYPYVSITIAGDGEDELFLKSTFQSDERVNFINYEPSEALEVHKNFDIAVVPSLCGEATCLAVLEAMAAGCAVLATNMGGMITEIISDYNGILCYPYEDEIYISLTRLIENPELRLAIQKRGWETSQIAFNFESWKSKWRDIINNVISSKKIIT